MLRVHSGRSSGVRMASVADCHLSFPHVVAVTSFLVAREALESTGKGRESRSTHSPSAAFPGRPGGFSYISLHSPVPQTVEHE